MNYESFSFSIDEYASELATQSHQTLYWLNRNGYLSNEATEDLLSRMIVTPVRNRPRLGRRLLERFFNKESQENSYVFPITLIDDVYEHDKSSGGEKPSLRVVK